MMNCKRYCKIKLKQQKVDKRGDVTVEALREMKKTRDDIWVITLPRIVTDP